MIRWLVVGALLIGATARADAPNRRLIAARKAVEEIRYDDARRLLLEALKHGGNVPRELAEIYRMSAVTAHVLGQPELAERYYRKLLAIDPKATLPADSSPRFRAPFEAAQAYMVAQRRLEVRARRTDDTIEVTIVSDPVSMIVRVIARADGIETASARLEGQRATLRPPDPGDVDQVVALDEFGNVITTIKPSASREGEQPASTAEPGASSIPIVRRWSTWAIPAAASAAVAIGFGVDGMLAKRRLDDIVGNSGEHFLDEAETERRRWKRDTLVRNIALVGAGAFVAVSVIVYATRPDEVSLVPTASSGELGLVLTGPLP
ncbi:MAG: hypothetical protein AB7P03_09765 [Kofleriaceae bacterium]